MSNDRNHDEQLSATYKDLATERTPEHLDNSVLRMAKARTERPYYSRWLTWSRPLAWAATVALCLAITLDMTQVTAPDNGAIETVPAEANVPATLSAPQLQKDKRAQQLNLSDAISSEKTSPARSAAKQVASEPAPAGRLRQSDNMAEEEIFEDANTAPTANYELKEASEPRRENTAMTAGYAASSALAADMPSNECSDDTRSKPDSWLECIENLEAAGDTEAALRQRQNLEETFPDFNLP